MNQAQALLDAVERQRNQALNQFAQAEAHLHVALEAVQRLTAQCDALTKRVAELEPPKEPANG